MEVRFSNEATFLLTRVAETGNNRKRTNATARISSTQYRGHGLGFSVLNTRRKIDLKNNVAVEDRVRSPKPYPYCPRKL